MREILNKQTGEVEVYTEDEYIQKRDSILMAWQASKDMLEEAKAHEMDMRKQAVDFCFDPNVNKGTERVELGEGYVAKSVKKLNYGFVKNEDNRVDKHRIDRALSLIEKDGPMGVLIAERLVKWTPDLSLTEYNQLPSEYKEIIDDVIVITEGAPTLEIIPPKVK